VGFARTRFTGENVRKGEARYVLGFSLFVDLRRRDGWQPTGRCKVIGKGAGVAANTPEARVDMNRPCQDVAIFAADFYPLISRYRVGGLVPAAFRPEPPKCHRGGNRCLIKLNS
jgi:hypothetical protein